ncbi:hypothetical protein GUJ93_ZPchr0008g12973 [Zizania palustris]|uniref:Uncharacterized protein n=1 Tax=Zizania palustris TaxID=103762 RepID=A0A8J5RX88_ZIZPA|nr:hypothetical protein GUJ93_ZPchr0008g12973 [Zizania palustris]
MPGAYWRTHGCTWHQRGCHHRGSRCGSQNWLMISPRWPGGSKQRGGEKQSHGELHTMAEAHCWLLCILAHGVLLSHQLSGALDLVTKRPVNMGVCTITSGYAGSPILFYIYLRGQET